MAHPRTVLIGGSGRLGSLLRQYVRGAIAPSHAECDVTSKASCQAYLRDADLVIHCAGILANESELNPDKAWLVNGQGAHNVLMAAPLARVVYVSTDYVFAGTPAHDPYREGEVPHPINVYGQTKLFAERAILQNPDNLVVRAPFRYGPPWTYSNAFDDQWTSGRWIAEVARDIATVVDRKELTGVLHMGGPRRNLYEFASAEYPGLPRAKRADWTTFRIPEDTALDSSRWRAWKEARW